MSRGHTVYRVDDASGRKEPIGFIFERRSRRTIRVPGGGTAVFCNPGRLPDGPHAERS